MAIVLGKDGTVTVNSATVVGVRNVTFSGSARTVDVEEYGTRFVAVYSTGSDRSLSMEVNDTTSLVALITALNSGTIVTVGGGSGSWSFPAVITAVNETAAVDGVVTFQVEAKLTREGTR